MADNEINVNALPVKTAPAAGDKMLMIGAAEEYQIDYDQLASAILDKLSTKQYSELDTTAKTVLGALDELNGKSLFGSVTHTSYQKQLSSESDYVTLAEMSANTNSIIVVKTQWLTGKPVGLRIIDKTTQTPYAIVEDAESGYLNLFFSPNVTTGAYTLQIQEKNSNPNGLSSIEIIEIQFDF